MTPSPTDGRSSDVPMTIEMVSPDVETECDVIDAKDKTPLSVHLNYDKKYAAMDSGFGGFNFCILLDADSAREVAQTLCAIADVLDGGKS